MNQKETLPHISGYEFIGVLPDKEVNCHMKLDSKMGAFYVDGQQGCRYCDLIGWKEITTYRGE